MKILGIIPARYASTRFPGKPLVEINGKSMIERVYAQALKSKLLDQIVVATDDDRIFNHVLSFGGNVLMTNVNHLSGTDRCFEALKIQKNSYDFVINIQGDEPYIQPEQIDLLALNLTKDVKIATLCKQINHAETLFNPNIPKVIFDNNKVAIYFSRHPIPYLRSVEQKLWIANHTYFKHIGIYAYSTDIIGNITRLNPSELELAESLEQLRWLQNGFKIHVFETDLESYAIDTPEDVAKIRIN